MTSLRIFVAATATALLAGSAFAQTTTVVTPETNDRVDVTEPDKIVEPQAGEAGEAATVDASTLVELDEDFVLPSLNLPIDSLDDYKLVDRNGKSIGEVEEVLGPNDQTATAIAVEFDGPGWGIFDDDVTRVVDISKFSIEGDSLIVDISAEEVRTLPVYDD